MVARNDHAAVAVLTSLSRAGLSIPGDVSITGYDDSRIARLPYHDLTSVRQDPAEIGNIAIECALSRISGERAKAEERVTRPGRPPYSSTVAP